MAAFSSLTDRLSNAFKHLKSKGKLSEADIDGTIREIRRALLDADVALDVVRSFTARIRERALGTEVSEALNPAQQVVKIVNEELIALMGSANSKLEVATTQRNSPRFNCSSICLRLSFATDP